MFCYQLVRVATVAILYHDVGKDWHATAVSLKDFTLNKSQPTTGSIAKIA